MTEAEALEEELVPRRGSGSGGRAEGGGGGGEGGPEEAEPERGRAGEEEAATGGGGAGHRHGRPVEAATRGGLALGMERENQRERDSEKRRKKMTYGACVSVTGEMKYTSSYTPAAGPRLCPYVFSGIFVGNEEL